MAEVEPVDEMVIRVCEVCLLVDIAEVEVEMVDVPVNLVAVVLASKSRTGVVDIVEVEVLLVDELVDSVEVVVGTVDILVDNVEVVDFGPLL